MHVLVLRGEIHVLLRIECMLILRDELDTCTTRRLDTCLFDRFDTCMLWNWTLVRDGVLVFQANGVCNKWDT